MKQCLIVFLLLSLFTNAQFLTLEKLRHSGLFFDKYGESNRVSYGYTMVNSNLSLSFSLNEFLIDTSRYYTNAPGVQRYPQIAYGGTNFLVVWNDYTRGELVGNLIAPDGTILFPSPFVISHTPGNIPALCFDGNNYFVVWFNNYTIYGARIKPDGTVIDTEGFIISANGNYNLNVAYGEGVYLVVWGAGNNTGVPGVHAAFVDTNGTVISEQVLCHNSGSPDVSFNGEYFWVIWQGYSRPFHGLYGCRLTSQGINLDPGGVNVVYQNAMMPVIDFDGTDWYAVWSWQLNDFSSVRINPEGIPFGEKHDLRGSWAMWIPHVVQGDSLHWLTGVLAGGTYPPVDIYLTRVDFKGNVIDSPWIPVDVSQYWQAWQDNAFGNHTFITVWEDQVPNWDIYFRRYAPDGNPLDSTRVLLNRSINSSQNPEVAILDTVYIIVYEDDRDNRKGIYGARVTEGGVVLDPEGFPISSPPRGGILPSIASGDTISLCAWTDIYDYSNIWGARIRADGTILDPTGIQITNEQIEHDNASVAYNNGIFLVSYARYALNYQWGILAKRIGVDGQLLDSADITIRAPETMAEAPRPEVAPYSNGFLITWRSSYNDLDGARVNFNGVVIDSTPIQISPPGLNSPWHGLASSGDTFLVAWEQDGNKIFARRIDSSGTILDPTPIYVCINQPNNRRNPSVTFDGTNFLVVWQDARNNSGKYDLFGARISRGGIVLDTNGVELINAEYSREFVELTSSNDGKCLLVYQGFKGAPYSTIKVLGAIYTPTGIAESYNETFDITPEMDVIPRISFKKTFILRHHLAPGVDLKIDVYDVSGRLVKVVYNGRVKSAGQIKFTLEQLPAGIYFVKINAANESKTIKVILV